MQLVRTSIRTPRGGRVGRGGLRRTGKRKRARESVVVPPPLQAPPNSLVCRAARLVHRSGCHCLRDDVAHNARPCANGGCSSEAGSRILAGLAATGGPQRPAGKHRVFPQEGTSAGGSNALADRDGQARRQIMYAGQRRRAWGVAAFEGRAAHPMKAGRAMMPVQPSPSIRLCRPSSCLQPGPEGCPTRKETQKTVKSMHPQRLWSCWPRAER